ncbi:MAG: nucleotidyltransferase family protein [Halioglobus sp.]|nr:nucleotidyltransferase family protein [Halioglobus sp.]
MRAMIFAAGVGERMRPLTDHTPKPLLQAGGKALIAYHLSALAAAGICEVVINVSHLGEQIEAFCGDGSAWGLQIAYSRERSPLETAGGIHAALPLLGDAPFLVVNGDVWSDYPLGDLAARGLGRGEIAHIVMVGNPPQHPGGDFFLDEAGWLRRRTAGQVGCTYAGIGVYAPAMFADLAPGKLPLRPLMDAAIDAGTLGGEFYGGRWRDIGTPERLAELDAELTA